MGRLSTLNRAQHRRVGAFFRGTPPALQLCALGVCALSAFACEESKNEPAQSRVQAVLAPQGERPTEVNTPTPAAAKPKAPKTPLCNGQLSAAQNFSPKHPPEQRAAAGAASLARDPLRGSPGRWTWVNFWAAWCAPCKQELPLLLQWKAAFAKDLEFAFVSIDDDERQLSQYLEQQPESGLRSSYWLPDGALRAEWLAELGLSSEPELPMQLLIDPAGKLRCRVQGAVESDDASTLRQLIAAP